VNLPNALTVGRIAITPLIALLPMAESWTLRLVAWTLFVMAAVTDYVDGMLARSRNEITDLGKMLDPLADKLLLIGTFVPMFYLMGSGGTLSLRSPHQTPFVDNVLGAMLNGENASPAFPFITPLGAVGLPWWVLAIVIGRELFMTVFRQAAARRGVVIAAIGPAKWKTTFQLIWQGAAYFWFWIATLAVREGWNTSLWRSFAYFNGIVGTLMMTAAVLLTLYSLVLYLRRYGSLFFVRRAQGVGSGRDH
jgi:CDP-diacylglycerol---glycerol-3-phosphate 3-phosphatidyltransferase